MKQKSDLADVWAKDLGMRLGLGARKAEVCGLPSNSDLDGGIATRESVALQLFLGKSGWIATRIAS